MDAHSEITSTMTRLGITHQIALVLGVSIALLAIAPVNGASHSNWSSGT